MIPSIAPLQVAILSNAASEWAQPVVPLIQKILTAPDMDALEHMVTSYAAHMLPEAEITLVWWLNGTSSQHRSPNQPLSPANQQMITHAHRSEEGMAVSVDGCHLATILSIPHAHVGAIILAESQRPTVVPSGWQELTAVIRPCITSALETMRLRQAETLQKALFEIADLAGSGLDMPKMLPQLHRIVSSLMYAENFYIALYDKNKESIRFIYYQDVVDMDPVDENMDVYLSEIERGLTWYLIKGAKPLMGSDRALREQVGGQLEDHGPDSLDWLGVPIISVNGDVRGVLVVQSYVDRPHYTQQDQALLTFVGSHILNTLDRRQAHEDLELRVDQRTHELTLEVQARQTGEMLQKTLFKIAELSNTVGSQETFYKEVHAIVGQWMNSNNFYIAHVSDDGKTLSFPYSVDEKDPPRQPRPVGRSMTDYVIRTKKPILASRAVLERLKEEEQVYELGAKSVCWLGVPLIVGDKVIGALAVQSYTPGEAYTTKDQELLTFISYQIANGLDRLRATEAIKEANLDLENRVRDRTKELMEQIRVRKQMENQLKHEVLHDSLTGLPNRAYLRDHLSLAMNRFQRHPDRIFAVVFMDLDRFKVINDSAGHWVGDELLKEVAKRFSECVRPTDIVARLGGDEFAMILDDLSGTEDAVRIVQRAIDSLKDRIVVAGKELFTAVSAGVVMSDARYQNPDDLLRDADVAMYRAKANTVKRFEIFDEKLHQEALMLLDLENDLRQGLLRNEFAPYLQPIVSLSDGSIHGFEALMRWDHPERGILPPGAFLKAAEAAGCMEDIDWLMFRNVMKGPAQHLTGTQYINLNISPRHFRDPEFDRNFLAALADHHLDGSKIRIEVTEGALVDNTQQACVILENLRDHSILTALDDFGTGYSSLSYVHQFPLHTLKIDRSFIVELTQNQSHGNTAVVRSILALAASLNLDVVAEGIETEAQRQALLDLGCVYGQGYLFSRPQPHLNFFPDS